MTAPDRLARTLIKPLAKRGRPHMTRPPRRLMAKDFSSCRQRRRLFPITTRAEGTRWPSCGGSPVVPATFALLSSGQSRRAVLTTMISVIGGVGLFLLGMAVMTDGLKALAGTALRGVLAKAAATPLHGTFWGAVITLLVQSSSATTMTTIGLVSAGLLTFPQGLSLVFLARPEPAGSWR